MSDLKDGFEVKVAGHITNAPKSLTHQEMIALLANPQENITLADAANLAHSRPPYGYSIKLTADGKGFVIGCHRGNQVSMFIKPNDTTQGAFWELNTLTGQFIRDENLAGHLKQNHQLYLAVYDCISSLKADGDSRIMLADAKYAMDYRAILDAQESLALKP
jgi:hypothetical protein